MLQLASAFPEKAIVVTPSRQLLKGSEFVNFRLLDHLIISEEGYFSFLDEGLLELSNDARLISHSNMFTNELQLSNA